MIEFDLRIPVARWILSRGMCPICEVGSLNNCDLVGIEIDGRKIVKMIAVELKLKDVAGVVRQCKVHQPIASETWAAMPPLSDTKKRRIIGEGIGLLEVSDGRCTEVAAPTREGGHGYMGAYKIWRDGGFSRWKNLIRRRDEYKWRMLHPRMLRHPAQELQAASDSVRRAATAGGPR